MILTQMGNDSVADLDSFNPVLKSSSLKTYYLYFIFSSFWGHLLPFWFWIYVPQLIKISMQTLFV